MRLQVQEAAPGRTEAGGRESGIHGRSWQSRLRPPRRGPATVLKTEDTRASAVGFWGDADRTRKPPARHPSPPACRLPLVPSLGWSLQGPSWQRRLALAVLPTPQGRVWR